MSDNDIDDFDSIFDQDDLLPPTDPEPSAEPEPEPENPELDPEPDPVDSEPAADPEPEPVDYKALYEKEQQRYKSFEGRYRKEKEEWDTHRPAPQEAPPQPTEDDTFLDKFRQEYNDDVVKAVELVAERKARALLNEFKQTAVDPLVESHAKSARDAHFSSIHNAHDDWETVVESPEFGQWVGNQPAYLQRTYQQILTQGSAHDVIDMLTTYKDARKAPSTPRSADPAKVRQASAVKPTRGGVSKPTATPKAQSWDDAWDEIE